jgi:predicted metal-dependent peptidase
MASMTDAEIKQLIIEIQRVAKMDRWLSANEIDVIIKRIRAANEARN